MRDIEHIKGTGEGEGAVVQLQLRVREAHLPLLAAKAPFPHQVGCVHFGGA